MTSAPDKRPLISLTPLPPSDEPAPLFVFFERVGPALGAALLFVWVIVLQEVFSDLVPVVATLITLPLWLVMYYLQGLVVGALARRNPRTSRRGPWGYAGLGALSGLWSSVVFASVATLIGLLVTTTVTFGAALVTLPVTLAGGLVDLLLNVTLTALGALIYRSRAGRSLAGLSCAVVGLSFSIYCLVVGAMGVFLATGGWKLTEPLLSRWHLIK